MKEPAEGGLKQVQINDNLILFKYYFFLSYARIALWLQRVSFCFWAMTPESGKTAMF